MHFYITGDTHRSFDRIEDFCYGYETTTEDVMIILGDAGINYWLDLSDKELKGRLSGMDITFSVFMGTTKHDHGRRQITKKRYGMKELCMWKNSIRIFCSQKMEKYIIFTERK